VTLFLDHQSLTLPNGVVGRPWLLPSADPVSFFQAISEPDQVTPTRIWAQTFLPRDTGWPPVVIIVPGSLGVADSHLHKAELLTDAGIAACLLDPFGSRGVTSTVSNQAQYSFAASAWDVLAAAAQLSRQGDVDPQRIGAQGHSRGGSAVLCAASMFKFTTFQQPLAGVYAAYPWCGMQFLNPAVGPTRVRAIIGDRDEWCLPQQVQGHMQALRLSGAEASWRIVPGAHHSFDRATAVELVADASVAPGAPTIYIDDRGACIHPGTGQADPRADERSLMLYGIKAGYGRRGARMGTGDSFADVFHDDMMRFWQQFPTTTNPTEAAHQP